MGKRVRPPGEPGVLAATAAGCQGGAVTSTLIFARHGESEANVAQVIANGDEGYPLTARGRQQVMALAGDLAGAGVEAVLTSPILRARQTAQLLGDRLGVPVTVRAGLRECFLGELEGRSDDDAWRRHYTLDADWMRHGRWERRAPGGESLLEVRDRFVALVDELRSGPGRRWVLVSHGQVLRAMLPVVLDNIDAPFSVAHPLAQTDTVHAEVSATSARCVSWAGRLVPAAG